MLRGRYERKKSEAAALGIKLRREAYIFSPDPDGRTPLKPDIATQKFGRMAKRLGIDAELKNWRHYNETELIAAGVDINVVAARLGHGGGGSTTLKSYTAYQAERSQRAADALIIRMPPRPQRSADVAVSGGAKVLRLPDADDPDLEPCRRIAADLRGAITSGFVPPIAELMDHYEVPGLNTIRAAQQLLVEDGMLETRHGVGVFVVSDRPRADRSTSCES